MWRAEAAKFSKSLRICFPPLTPGGFSCMHSKLMLLFYGHYMRIVVPSANLMS